MTPDADAAQRVHWKHRPEINQQHIANKNCPGVTSGGSDDTRDLLY